MQMLCPPPIPLLGLYRVGDGFRKGQPMQMLYHCERNTKMPKLDGDNTHRCSEEGGG